MKRIIYYITFAYLTGFTATSGIAVIAGGCSSHMNKKAVIKCVEKDTDCVTEKSEKYELNKTVRS